MFLGADLDILCQECSVRSQKVRGVTMCRAVSSDTHGSLPAQSCSREAVGGGHAAVSAGVRPSPQPLPRLQPYLQVRDAANVDAIICRREIAVCGMHSDHTRCEGLQCGLCRNLRREHPAAWTQLHMCVVPVDTAVVHRTRRGGSSSEPETASMTLTRAHELLIVATDGVWDAVTEAEAVNLVGDAATVAAGCQQARTAAGWRVVLVSLRRPVLVVGSCTAS